MPVVACGGEVNRAAALGVLGGVVEQIADDLGEPHEVAVHPHRLGLHLDRK
jgi:hypothetical protein